MSLVRMAEAVGIGAIGKNGLLFHSEYGPRLMLGGVITTAALPKTAWPARGRLVMINIKMQIMAELPLIQLPSLGL